MKKWTSFILILIIALNLAGCSNRNVNRNLQNKPDITGTVLEVQDNSILLEINKEGYPDGTRCKVSLNEKNRDNYAEVSVGDEVVVQKFLNKWTIFLFCSILFSSNQKEH